MTDSENGCYTIPGETTCIKEDAFRGCPSLTFITIHEGVTSIGNNAFTGTGLKTITIPKNVAHIGEAVFSNCKKLSSITVDPENKNFCSDDGVLFSKDKSTLLQYPSNREGETYSIPAGVTKIAPRAFDRCKKLASIYVEPDNKMFCSDGGVLFNKNKSLLVKYPPNRDDKTYVIPDNVTGIETAAFSYCAGLLTITIPEGVTRIGDYAFFVCDRLTSITIPEGVTIIGDHAFHGCARLTSLTIPEGVTIIGDAAFGGSGLSSITMPEGVAYIGDRAFFYCEQLTSVTISEGVTVIGDYAFHGCKYLTSLTIPEGVTIIGDAAFGSSGLSSIIMPESVTSIGHSAFHWTNLESITIPKNVTGIGKTIFSCCCKLASIVVDPENKLFCSDGGVLFSKDKSALLKYPPGKKDKTYKISKDVTAIAADAFDGYDTSITRSKRSTAHSCIQLGGYGNLASIAVDPENKKFCSESGVLFSKDKSTLLKYPPGKKGKMYSIPDGVTTIADWAFVRCFDLTSITIPERVISIGNNAFNGTDLKTITIPKNVANIGDVVFFFCYELASIVVDPENKNFCSDGGVLFNKDKTALLQYPPAKKDKTYSIPDGVTIIAECALDGCENLREITIPESITVIDENIFRGCENLKTITIPESITGIESWAFNETNLKSITIPKNVANIGERAFSDCENLVSIIVEPENKQFCSDGGVLFSKDKSTLLKYPPNRESETYSIPEGVTTIAERDAFWDCKNLKSITIPKSVAYIGERVFSNCRNLASITVDPENKLFCSDDGVLFSKDKSTFLQYPSNRENKTYSIPEGVTTIAESAFEGCENLRKITLPEGAAVIEMDAFWAVKIWKQ